MAPENRTQPDRTAGNKPTWETPTVTCLDEPTIATGGIQIPIEILPLQLLGPVIPS